MRPQGPFSTPDKRETPPSEEKLVQTPLLSPDSVRNVLHKSTAALAAFSGYDAATDGSLNVLTDAASHFMQTLCGQMLRTTRDRGLAHGGDGFADAMDRTLTEVHGSGLEELATYYQHCVIHRYWGIVSQCRNALKECRQTAQLEKRFPQPAIRSLSPASGQQGIRGRQTFPEIHFPSEADGGGVAIGGAFSAMDALQTPSSQIETGLQMLQSLEETGTESGQQSGVSAFHLDRFTRCQTAVVSHPSRLCHCRWHHLPRRPRFAHHENTNASRNPKEKSQFLTFMFLIIRCQLISRKNRLLKISELGRFKADFFSKTCSISRSCFITTLERLFVHALRPIATHDSLEKLGLAGLIPWRGCAIV